MSIDTQLRNILEADLAIFFNQQVDPIANDMAAFTFKEPTDRVAFMAHWAKIMADETIIVRTILLAEQIVGYVLCHSWFGNPEVSYWLGREYWGQGIATNALSAFLHEVKVRPFYARAAKDNMASIRVLEKCGFVISGEDCGFANARGMEIEEVILSLI